MTNTLDQSISEGISEWMKEQEENGEVAVAKRPATFDDFLKAQREMSFKKTNKRVSFTGAVEPIPSHLESQNEKFDEEKPATPATESNIKEMRNTSKLLRTMSTRGSRLSQTNSTVWQSMVHELDVKLKKLDADGHFKDTGSLKVPWYAPPYQRQQWGDEQVLPIVNHGTLFFDLFFVGAIYNLGEMLISAVAVDIDDGIDDRFRAFIYCLGIFGPIFSTWEFGVYYQSRYVVA